VLCPCGGRPREACVEGRCGPSAGGGCPVRSQCYASSSRALMHLSSAASMHLASAALMHLASAASTCNWSLTTHALAGWFGGAGATLSTDRVVHGEHWRGCTKPHRTWCSSHSPAMALGACAESLTSPVDSVVNSDPPMWTLDLQARMRFSYQHAEVPHRVRSPCPVPSTVIGIV